MTFLIARLLLLAAAGGFLALGLPRDWVEPVLDDPIMAQSLAAALALAWAGAWAWAKRQGWLT